MDQILLVGILLGGLGAANVQGPPGILSPRAATELANVKLQELRQSPFTVRGGTDEPIPGLIRTWTPEVVDTPSGRMATIVVRITRDGASAPMAQLTLTVSETAGPPSPRLPGDLSPVIGEPWVWVLPVAAAGTASFVRLAIRRRRLRRRVTG